MKCIIIDDEETSRNILKKLISKIKELNLVSEFNNAKDAFEYLKSNEIDLIFLDLHMPQISGYDLLDLLPIKPKVVITTTDKELAIKSFDYKCIVDYLHKPFNVTRFLRAVDEANKPLINKDQITIESFPQNNDLIIKINRRLIYIKIDRISIIKAKGNEIQILANNQCYYVKSTLAKIEEILPDTMFINVKNSCLINTNKIIGDNF